MIGSAGRMMMGGKAAPLVLSSPITVNLVGDASQPAWAYWFGWNLATHLGYTPPRGSISAILSYTAMPDYLYLDGLIDYGPGDNMQRIYIFNDGGNRPDFINLNIDGNDSNPFNFQYNESNWYVYETSPSTTQLYPDTSASVSMYGGSA
jgi:hypothetical protein